MNDVAFYDFIMRITVIVCVTLLVIAILFIRNRSSIAKQQTLQKLVESGQEVSTEVLESLNLKPKNQPQQDLRKGILLLVSGSILAVIFKFMGGMGWILGLVPIIIGLVYIAFARSKGMKQ